jgi:hypothetical protein
MKLTSLFQGTLTAGLVLFGLVTPAPAQTLNMDMSWAIQQQQMCWDQGMLAAQMAAQNYLAQVQAYRAATGYTGPMPSPVSTAQLQQSIQGMNQAFDDYNQSWYANSAAQSAAIENHCNQAILGQQNYLNPYTGDTYTLSNQSNFQWVDPSGCTLGTETFTPPDYQSTWTPLEPMAE